ncbi:unnamed protein product [Aphanomyces euteiches]|uniref:Leucyl/phenylalanyl-tRNA--protein transferase n=1 Tax=Aphanomyces euteiches TaxID=100861 RepID=A0A6G0XVT6_9STRA|nr:hypothetical protein Ae201684_001100 [Aphanomyces euteiches]KAH9099662.1 hypothetical protein Ae201684P_018675 [Aphanomyces euteiches]KAH9145541.1 hypothetical protein AeRB84_010531 [Aphanomyces euteiches]
MASEQLDEEFVPPHLRRLMWHSHRDFWVSQCVDPVFVAAVMHAGFLPIATLHRQQFYLLPKMHEERCVMDPTRLHIPKQIRKKAKGYRLTINQAFDRVVQGCHNQHGVSWLFPPIVTAFRALVPGVTVQNTTIKVYSIELWKGDELAAGELGYCNGAMFTSLTGFVSPGASGAGTMQLYALGALLHVCQFQLWDLGMAMAYKTALGAYPMARIDFVQRVHTLRNIPVTLIEDERQAKDIIEQHLHL